MPSHIESLFFIAIKLQKRTQNLSHVLKCICIILILKQTTLFFMIQSTTSSIENLFPSKITVCIAIFAANSTGKLYTPIDIEGNTIDLIRLVFSYTSSILNFSYHNSSLLLNLNFTYNSFSLALHSHQSLLQAMP